MAPDRDVGWLSVGLLSLLLTGTTAAATPPPDDAAPDDSAIARFDGIAAAVRDRLPPPADDAAGEAAPQRHAQGWQNWTNWGNFWQNA
jgi:hypothetical protein